MMRQPSPRVVSPPPPAVPREMVTYSRMVLLAPRMQRVGSPAYLRSCVATPTQAKGQIVVPAPTVRWPASSPTRTTWEMRRQFSPRTTLGPMVEYGPMVQDAGMYAPAAMMAVGWMLAAVLTRSRLRQARRAVLELERAWAWCGR